MGHEKDTSSMIVTGARNLTVFDDTGDFAGAAQQFGQDRQTERDAIDAAMTPPAGDTAPFDFDDMVVDMKTRGYVWCNGRCQTFLHHSEFSIDERNPGRLYRQSYCKACMSRMIQGKRQVNARGQRSDGYRYQARKKKRRGKRKG